MSIDMSMEHATPLSLTIPTPQYFNGTYFLCRDTITLILIGSDTLNIQLACKCVCVGATSSFEGVVNRHHPFVGMLTLPGVI